MASVLSIVAVTAVLKHLLESKLYTAGLLPAIGGDASISVLPPDRVVVGAEEKPQLNLFLYQVRPHTGLRRDHGPQSSAFELFYLMSAYGASDFEIDLLLGYALQLFQEHTALDHETVRGSIERATRAEGGRHVAPPLRALGESSLDDEIVEIALSPQFLALDELSKLWSALQARYRPSIACKAAVVLRG
jgi:hypothetical protein